MASCACCCFPGGARLDPALPLLPPGVVHLTTESNPELVAEAVEIAALSFAGSTADAPEGTLSWVLDTDASGANPCAPLLDPPSDARLHFFRYLMRWSFVMGLRYGGCFALKDEGGRLVTAAVTYPPNSINPHNPGVCELLSIICRLGLRNMPPEFYKGPQAKRFQAVDEALKQSHRDHASGPHLYILCFATAAGHQGKGYGRRLLSFINEVADGMGVDSYLETSGSRNERFYERNGYEVKDHHALECADRRFDPEGLGGFTAMIRKPQSS